MRVYDKEQQLFDGGEVDLHILTLVIDGRLAFGCWAKTVRKDRAIVVGLNLGAKSGSKGCGKGWMFCNKDVDLRESLTKNTFWLDHKLCVLIVSETRRSKRSSPS